MSEPERTSEVAGERGNEERGERSGLGASLSTRGLRGLELVEGERPAMALSRYSNGDEDPGKVLLKTPWAFYFYFTPVLFHINFCFLIKTFSKIII